MEQDLSVPPRAHAQPHTTALRQTAGEGRRSLEQCLVFCGASGVSRALFLHFKVKCPCRGLVSKGLT